MTRFLRYFLLVTIPSFAFAQSLQIPDFDNWYQVEIIVFKQKRQPVSDEIWPLEVISYPANMVSVSPVSNEQITPYSLSQLEDLIDSKALFDTGKNEPAPIFDGFLFEDRGNYLHNRQLMESANQVEPMEEKIETGAETEPNEVSEEPGLDFTMADELLNSALPQAFRALSGEVFTLSTIARSLRRSSRYELLLHQAWRQPIDTQPIPVLIQTGNRYDDLYEVDGTLSFSRSRFLHLQTNLWFTQFEPKFNQQQFVRIQSGDLTKHAGKYPELVAMERNKDTHIAVHSHTLRHSRRMRSSVLHYIDHPFFGVLVKIDNFTYSLETAAE